MQMFGGLLAEDKVDRWNHRWAVILLLLLSLTTWLVLLQQSSSFGAVSKSHSEVDRLRYTANCWCPAQFTGAQVEYVNIVCGAAINQAVNTEAVDHIQNANPVANVFVSNADSVTEAYSAEIPQLVPVTKDYIMGKKEQNNSQTVPPKSKEKHFIYGYTPLILFVFALALKVPHILWSLLSGFVGVGVNKILESAKATQFYDVGVKGQFKQNLVKIVTQSTFTTSLLYILFKIIILLLLVFGLFVIRYTIIPQVEDDLVNDAGATPTKAVVASCHYNIRNLENLHSYSVQCMLTLDTHPNAPDSSTSHSPGSHEYAYAHFYKTLFNTLEVFFAVLALVNIASIFIWILALVPGPFRRKAFSNSGFSTDVCLLLYLARQNIGLLVAEDLEQSFASDIGDDRKRGEELKEVKE